ncbi:DUF5630 domain-containing protein [Legionella lytica]|uniref:DUF5630 domain-containing protein n=1 Tax=Legionella lytica TaxID=96232 RepID=A0ABY4Y878_9GAMM|nr:DUF5630 domain-containing protein [Legionella lytica]USQ13583.1 DUF5630 domain-containing protein [Legionella lytica]
MNNVEMKASKLDVLLRNASSGNNKSEEEKLIDYLNSFTLIDLINLLAENEHLYTELKHPRYAPYWDKELTNLPIATDNSSFAFKKQKNVASLDFLMGYILAIQLAGEELVPSYEQFFELATTYHSLYALHLGIQFLLRSLQEAPNIAAEDLTHYEELVLNEIRHHGTPGYLLASSFSFHLMGLKINGAREIDDVAERYDILYLKDGDLYKTYFYAVIARLLEPCSENEKHNAYLGDSFANYYPVGVDSIEQIEKWLLQRYPTKFTTKVQHDLNALALEAIHDLQNYLDQRQVERAFIRSPESPGRNQYGETPILIAARLGNFNEMVALAGVHGVERLKDTDNHGNTAWHFAVLTQNIVLQAYLKQNVPELLSISNKYGYVAPDSSLAKHYKFFQPAAAVNEEIFASGVEAERIGEGTYLS